MIDIFGKKQIQDLRNQIRKFKRRIAELTYQKIQDEDLSLSAVSTDTQINNYQVSYYLRNPNDASLRTIISVAKRAKELSNQNFNKQTSKFVLHPTHIFPAESNEFYLSSSDLASIFCVDLEDCVSAKFATDDQKKNCIHLKLD